MPKEYRSEEDDQKHHYMRVWRTAAWREFQQGVYGHVKPKLITFGHNIKGLELLHGGKAPRDTEPQVAWKHRPLQDRIAESSTWSE